MDADCGNVGALLLAAAERRGDHPAILDEDGRVVWSFAGLAEAAGRIAAGLAARGIDAGDRVVVLVRDRRAIFEAVAGVLLAGGTVVIPPLSLPPGKALRVAASTGPRAVIASPALWLPALLEPRLRGAPIRITTGRPWLAGSIGIDLLRRSQPMAARPVPSTATAILSFTSGTTGTLKPIERTHGVLRHQHEALAALRGLGDDDRDLVGVPLIALQNLAAGVTSVPAPRLRSRGADGALVRAALARARATSAVGFPSMLEAASIGARAGELGALRSVHLGGTRVHPSLLEGLARAAPNATATIAYGSTECEPIAAIDGGTYAAHFVRSRAADGVCVGTLVAGVDMRVVPRQAGRNGISAAPHVGHLQVKGARVAAGRSTDGWVDTGDVGWLDDEGRVWLLGRAANVVGDRFPFAVERAIEELPWVARAAMVRSAEHPVPRAFVAVEPRRGAERSAAGRPAARAGTVRRILRASAIGPDELPADVAIMSRIPIAGGPGAKVDEARLRRTGAERLPAQRAAEGLSRPGRGRGLSFED